MVKTQIRIIRALAILLMLSASPLSVTYTFAENKGKHVENREFKAILTEKMIDGKLQVRQYVLSEEISEADLKRTLSFDDQMSWAYVNYKAFQSGIILFDGKASKIGENLWEISIKKDITDENLIFKVIFSGKISETDEENGFAISFVNSMMKNLETAQNIKLLQNVDSGINSEKSIGSNQEFRNSTPVR